MNGKQAKRLRRAALGLATTLSEAGKDIKKDGYQVRKHSVQSTQSFVASTRSDTSSSSSELDLPASYQLLVRKDSLKGIYKTLKSGKM